MDDITIHTSTIELIHSLINQGPAIHDVCSLSLSLSLSLSPTPLGGRSVAYISNVCTIRDDHRIQKRWDAWHISKEGKRLYVIVNPKLGTWHNDAQRNVSVAISIPICGLTNILNDCGDFDHGMASAERKRERERMRVKEGLHHQQSVIPLQSKTDGY